MRVFMEFRLFFLSKPIFERKGFLIILLKMLEKGQIHRQCLLLSAA